MVDFTVLIPKKTRMNQYPTEELQKLQLYCNSVSTLPDKTVKNANHFEVNNCHKIWLLNCKNYSMTWVSCIFY